MWLLQLSSWCSAQVAEASTVQLTASPLEPRNIYNLFNQFSILLMYFPGTIKCQAKWLTAVPWDQLKWVGLTNRVAIHQITIVI